MKKKIYWIWLQVVSFWYLDGTKFSVITTFDTIVELYCVDLEVWSKLAKCVLIMRIVSKRAHDFDCDWQRINTFSHCITQIRVLLSQIISYSDTKVPVLVVMECKRANVVYVYEVIFLLHTSRSTVCMHCMILVIEHSTSSWWRYLRKCDKNFFYDLFTDSIKYKSLNVFCLSCRFPLYNSAFLFLLLLQCSTRFWSST